MQLQLVPESDRNLILSAYKKVLQLIEDTRNATNPYFDKLHSFILELKAVLTVHSAVGGNEETKQVKHLLQIYSNRLSQPCRTIIIFCKLHGIEFEEINVSGAKGQQFTPKYKVGYVQNRTLKPLLGGKLDPEAAAVNEKLLSKSLLGPESDRNRILSPYKKVLQWIEDTKNATNPYFDELHSFILELKSVLTVDSSVVVKEVTKQSHAVLSKL
ncbi:glutathione S-transferase T1-like [Apium graveolens]|uniref:glutathione S-transferase T1-like n=1 Tax=Apium graveolens TaxID=4045 RepID=UPI003D79F248